MNLLGLLFSSPHSKSAEDSTGLGQLAQRLVQSNKRGSNEYSNDDRNSKKSKQNARDGGKQDARVGEEQKEALLYRQLSLTALIVTYPTDEELVAQMSEDLYLWHERRGRILYGLCHDSDCRSPKSTTVDKLIVNRRSSNIFSQKPPKFSSDIWTFNFASPPITREDSTSTGHIASALHHEFSLPCVIQKSLSQHSLSKSSPVLFSSHPTKSIQPPPKDPGKLHVIVVGTGPQPIVILHGMVSSANFFLEGLLPLISPQFLRDVCTFYIPDMMGYGKSVRILANENYSVSEQAARIYCDVIHHYSLQTYHILGHSYGGMVAIALSAIRPENVRTLTLLSPAYFESLQIAKRVMQDAPFPCPYITRNPDLGRRILQLMRSCLVPIVPMLSGVLPSTTLTETSVRELISTEPEATLGTVETMRKNV